MRPVQSSSTQQPTSDHMRLPVLGVAYHLHQRGEGQMVVMPPIAPLQNVLEGLDEAQRRAVAATEGPVLLIAGPARGRP